MASSCICMIAVIEGGLMEPLAEVQAYFEKVNQIPPVLSYDKAVSCYLHLLGSLLCIPSNFGVSAS